METRVDGIGPLFQKFRPTLRATVLGLGMGIGLMDFRNNGPKSSREQALGLSIESQT